MKREQQTLMEQKKQSEMNKKTVIEQMERKQQEMKQIKQSEEA